MKGIIKAHSLPMVTGSGIDYLMEDQVNALTKSFQDWYDASERDAQRRSRGKYWLTFLALRYTGARVIVDVKCPLNVEIKSPLKKARRCTLGGMR